MHNLAQDPCSLRDENVEKRVKSSYETGDFIAFTIITLSNLRKFCNVDLPVEPNDEIRRQSSEIDRKLYQNCRVDPLFPFRSKGSTARSSQEKIFLFPYRLYAETNLAI